MEYPARCTYFCPINHFQRKLSGSHSQGIFTFNSHNLWGYCKLIKISYFFIELKFKVSKISLHEHGHSFFDSPSIIADNYLVISSSDDNSILLLTHETSFAILRRLKIPSLETMVRRPILFDNFLFLLTKKGLSYCECFKII